MKTFYTFMIVSFDDVRNFEIVIVDLTKLCYLCCLSTGPKDIKPKPPSFYRDRRMDCISEWWWTIIKWTGSLRKEDMNFLFNDGYVET